MAKPKIVPELNKDCQLHYHQSETTELLSDDSSDVTTPQVITLAVNTKDTFDGNTVSVGVAICHEGERFDKKLGRSIAIGRAFCDRLNVSGRFFVPKEKAIVTRVSDTGISRQEVSWDAVEQGILAVVSNGIEVSQSIMDAILYMTFDSED